MALAVATLELRYLMWASSPVAALVAAMAGREGLDRGLALEFAPFPRF